MNNVQNIDALIGRPVLSLETANRLGQIHDVIVDPLSGSFAGFSIQRAEQSYALVEQREIHSIGPDAVMTNTDDSLIATDESPLKNLSLAKTQLIGVRVVTQHGQFMGNVSNIYIHLAETPAFIYEVRSSIFDKLLGHAFYFPASLASAFSDDRTALVVSDDPDTMDRSLVAATRRLCGDYRMPQYHVAGGVQVTVRSHSD